MRIDLPLRHQLTLALLKPDLYANPKHVAIVMGEIKQKESFMIHREQVCRWTRTEAEKFYLVHQGRPYFDRLTNYMSSGPFLALLMSGENAIERWRRWIGPTKVTLATYASPDSLRARFGLSDTRNSFHGSDSIENALDEAKHCFRDLPNEVIR